MTLLNSVDLVLFYTNCAQYTRCSGLPLEELLESDESKVPFLLKETAFIRFVVVLFGLFLSFLDTKSLSDHG